MVTGVHERAVEYMDKCRLCTIATASVEGQPSAATVFFKNSGLDIYFNTGRQTQKARNILVNPSVAIVMQEAGPVPDSDRDIKGIQYTGQATVLSNEDTAEVPETVMARHRAFNSSGQGNSVIIKVTPVRIYLIDYSRGFRHRDLIEF